MKKVTMKDIAMALGLSINTVSHAINDREDISDATKQRVRSKAKELGYVPNLSARGLRQGLTRMVAVLYDNLLNPYYSIMIKYLDEKMSQYGYSFMTFIAKKFDKRSMDSMLMRGVDGIISFLEPAGLDETNIAIPVLLLGRKTEVKTVDCVYGDDAGGGEIAAEYLADSGCKKALFLGENLSITCLKDRLSGFKAGCERRSMESAEFMLEERTLSDAEEKLAAALKDCDGVFCFNDLLALELVSMLQRRGMDGIRIVGYDDLLAEFSLPCRLTSIGGDKKLMAETAAERLEHYMRTGSIIARPAPVIDVALVER